MNIENCPTARLRDLERLFQRRVCETHVQLCKAREERDEDNIMQAALELERYKGIYDAIVAELERRRENVTGH